jgi:16S rRNA (cytosine967-C5)-methyltransferase
MLVTGDSSHPITAARSIAHEVLEKVSDGAYSSDSLRGLSSGLTARDAGLASQIVFGCLRYQGQLDFLIFHYSGQRPEKLDIPVRVALRSALFQIRYLNRIPRHAAVHESVEYVKRRKRSATAFANAVLRKVGRESVRWPDIATELSVPGWLLERWSSHFGEQAARGIAAAALEEPAQYVRIPGGKEIPAGLRVTETGIQGAYRLLSPAPPGWRLHDIGSQAVIPLLDLREGDRYVDLCAAPGNKTLQALETRLGLSIACDVSYHRLREVPAICPRVVLDASKPLPFARLFNRIFIDAPCSGTGTLARNPEIKWRLVPGDLPRFREKQRQILAQAMALLEPGGKLLYATCSFEKEENEAVVSECLERHSGLVCTKELWRLPGRDEGDGFFAAVFETTR